MSVIRVNNIYKKFKIYYDKGQTFKEKILFRNRNHYEDRWVLKGVDFEVDTGEVVGLIGHNGCGKSTLLKLLTKIMWPDNGNIQINGRISSLLELGAGFHPDLRGKENIYTNASIFGLTRKEIDSRLDEIIEFSELGEFINNPVRTYSSGMYMRLAFSVAINVDADILLIDEILAVGDANFQVKCMEKLRTLKEMGTTIIIVTHDTAMVKNFCTKAIWLNDGKIVSSGNPAKTVSDYLSFMSKKKNEDTKVVPMNVSESLDAMELETVLEISDEEKASIHYDDNRFGLGYIKITDVKILDAENRPTQVLKTFDSINIVLSYQRYKNLTGYIFGFSFYTTEGVLITGSNTQLDQVEIQHLSPQGYVTLRINQLTLAPGRYALQVAVASQDGVPMDYYKVYDYFEVVSTDKSIGLVVMERAWEI